MIPSLDKAMLNQLLGRNAPPAPGRRGCATYLESPYDPKLPARLQIENYEDWSSPDFLSLRSGSRSRCAKTATSASRGRVTP